MQNCNLARSLQFLRLDSHLTNVKCDCNGFAVVTVVNIVKKLDIKRDLNAHNNYKQ